jgi:hypothetical protein
MSEVKVVLRTREVCRARVVKSATTSDWIEARAWQPGFPEGDFELSAAWQLAGPPEYVPNDCQAWVVEDPQGLRHVVEWCKDCHQWEEV